MAPIRAPTLYTAAQLDLDEASPGSTIELTLSVHSTFLASSRSLNQRIVQSISTVQDESTFSAKCLATESSIFLRHAQRSPRSFLWRILESRTVLELQAVDLSQDAKTQGDASLTLRLRFPQSIKPYGVAFADPDDRDALSVFVLTTPGDLYTITLRKEVFSKASASESSSGDWYKVFQPSAFSFRTPYRLFAISALELVVSLHDGGLLRLSRKPADDGSNWRDTFFSISTGFTGSFRGLIPWKPHHTVRFENIDLDPSAASAILASPDGQHFITAGLDHTLRAWNVNTGKVGLQLDLLGEGEGTEKKNPQYLIGPSQAQLIQLVELTNSEGILYYVVTYSPKGQQFKIWGILDADSGRLGIRDMCDETVLAPPLDDLMDASMWTMEEFHVEPKNHWRETEIWLRARSGPSSKVYSLKFDLFAERKDLQQVWQNNWVTVGSSASASSPHLHELSPQLPDSSAVTLIPLPTVTERWTDFLFYPGRFSNDSLGTALFEFSSKTKALALRNSTPPPSVSNRSLKQQIVDVVNLAASVHQSDDNTQLDTDLASIWRQFFALVRNLEKQRLTILSLQYDAKEGLPWIISADSVAAVQSCSEVEAVCLNDSYPTLSAPPSQSYTALRLTEDEAGVRVATLLKAAQAFRASLPKSFHDILGKAVEIEVLEEPSTSGLERIQAFDGIANLSTQVSDDDYTRLVENLRVIGGFEEVDNTAFFDAIQKLAESTDGSGGRLSICHYGAKQLIKNAQEVIQLVTETLFDLLVLTVFLAVELEPQDLSPQFQPQALFDELITQLRDQTVRGWMASTLRPNRSTGSSHRKQLSIHKTQSSLLASSPSLNFSTDTQVSSAQTVLESMFIGDWPSVAATTGQPKSQLLTDWCRAWVYGADLSNNFEEYTAYVLSHLVKYGDAQIAAEFAKFVPITPWAGYVKGRLAVQLGQFDKAASLFRRSSFGLGLSHFDVQTGDRARLLDEAERSYFTAGLAPYYQHIVSIFEKAKAHSYVVEFANLGIQSMRVAGEDMDEDVETELLSRLFSACMATARFEEAYSAISQQQNSALRKANLTTLLTALLSPSQSPSVLSPLLTRLPFTTSASDADAIIASLAAKALSVTSGVGARFYKALYVFRIARCDYRGAAEAIWQRLQRLRGSGEKAANPDTREGEEIRRCWLALCNCLACVDTSQAWIFSEATAAENGVNAFGGKRLSFAKVSEKKADRERTIVTLDDCRKGYQEELDRVEAIKMGRFAFVGSGGREGGDEMDVL